MKIYTRVVMNRDLEVVDSDSFEYRGPVASCDPMTMLAASTMFQVAGHVSAGKQARRAGEFQEQQYNMAAGQVQAASQRQAMDEDRKSRLVQSRAQAVAAASGAGASDVTVMDQIANIAAEGEYRSRIALYEGDDKARALRLRGAAAKAEGKSAQRASYLRAATSAMSMYAKYNAGSTGGIGYGSANAEDADPGNEFGMPY